MHVLSHITVSEVCWKNRLAGFCRLVAVKINSGLGHVDLMEEYLVIRETIRPGSGHETLAKKPFAVLSEKPIEIQKGLSGIFSHGVGRGNRRELLQPGNKIYGLRLRVDHPVVGNGVAETQSIVFTSHRRQPAYRAKQEEEQAAYCEG